MMLEPSTDEKFLRGSERMCLDRPGKTADRLPSRGLTEFRMNPCARKDHDWFIARMKGMDEGLDAGRASCRSKSPNSEEYNNAS